MNSFYKSFLIDSPLGTSEQTRSVVFAFGKHPCWDDHIEEIGIVNDSIALAKRILYVNGIGSIIDSGDWESATPEKIVTDFDHTYVWFRKNEFLIGQLWASSDGKGRSKYPMVIGCHLKQVPLNLAFKKIFPYLKILEARCKSCSKQTELLKAVEETQSSICQVLSIKSKDIDKNQKAKQKRELRESLLPKNDEIEQTEEGWIRILYHLKSQLTNYTDKNFRPKHFNKQAIGAEVLRLPLINQSFENSVGPWLRFLQTQISTDTPLLFIAPRQMPWNDIIIGEPSKRELFNLKVSLESFPYPYQIPYSINDEFKNKAQGVMRVLTKGKSSAKACIFSRSFDWVSTKKIKRWFW